MATYQTTPSTRLILVFRVDPRAIVVLCVRMQVVDPVTFHKRREAERRQQREAVRLAQLEAARQAIQQIAPGFPAISRVYLFGTIVQPGFFTQSSDIDVAVVCDDVAQESRFWRALEQALRWNVDVRPYQGVIVQAVADQGECVYARESDTPGTQYPE